MGHALKFRRKIMKKNIISVGKLEKIKASAKVEVLERILNDAKKYSVDVAFCAKMELRGAKILLEHIKSLEETND